MELRLVLAAAVPAQVKLPHTAREKKRSVSTKKGRRQEGPLCEGHVWEGINMREAGSQGVGAHVMEAEAHDMATLR